MSLDNLLLSEELTEAELTELQILFSNKVVRKYLRCMATNSTKELLAVSHPSNDPELIVRLHSVTHGRLEVFSTLLDIGEPKPVTSNNKE